MSGIKLNSRNHKPQLYSEMSNKSKEDAWLEEEERKRKVADLQREAEKADADKLKTMIDAIHSLEALFSSVEMQSGKGNQAKEWLNERMLKAGFNGEIMYYKLKGE